MAKASYSVLSTSFIICMIAAVSNAANNTTAPAPAPATAPAPAPATAPSPATAPTPATAPAPAPAPAACSANATSGYCPINGYVCNAGTCETPCPTPQYLSTTISFGCNGGGGSVSVSLARSTTYTIAEIPENVSDVNVIMTANGDLDLKLYDGTSCKFGYGCTTSSRGTHSYTAANVSVYFSGDDTTNPVSEQMILTGKMTKAMTLKVTAYAAATGTVTFTSGAIVPCPAIRPGCMACSTYQSCTAPEVGICDGTSNVTCGPAPPTPAPTAAAPAPSATTTSGAKAATSWVGTLFGMMTVLQALASI